MASSLIGSPGGASSRAALGPTPPMTCGMGVVDHRETAGLRRRRGGRCGACRAVPPAAITVGWSLRSPANEGAQGERVTGFDRAYSAQPQAETLPEVLERRRQTSKACEVAPTDRCSGWRSPRMGTSWPPPAPTGPYGCGTSQMSSTSVTRKAIGVTAGGRTGGGRFRTRYTPTDAAMLRKNTIIELMALPMNAPVWAGLGMMKTKIKMRMSSVRSHLGMHLDCPPHASGARPCAGVVAEGIQLVRGGCDVRMTSRGRPSHRTRCCTTLDGRFLEHGASVHLDMAGGRP